MQEYEKYGNDCMKIARVLSTRTPAQIKKHAESFFKKKMKTNSAAVEQYIESLSLWECLTAGCKAFSLANVKGMGTKIG